MDGLGLACTLKSSISLVYAYNGYFQFVFLTLAPKNKNKSLT